MIAARAWLRVFAIAVPLNFLWEMVQAPLYASMGTFWQGTWRCLVASLGDGALVLVVAVVGTIIFGSPVWFTRTSATRVTCASGVGLVLAIAVELWGLETGRWSYAPRMPIVPGTGLAAIPLMQLALLVPLSFRLSRLSLRTGSHDILIDN